MNLNIDPKVMVVMMIAAGLAYIFSKMYRGGPKGPGEPPSSGGTLDA